MTRAHVRAAWVGSVAAAGLLLVPSVSSQAATKDQGQALFQEHCGGCHLERGFGTRVLARRTAEGQALLESREDLDPRFVELAVRRGVGSMPPIRRTELGDDELAAIARYLEKRP